MNDEPLLMPAERMALTVGYAQVMRGDEPMPNIASVCILALHRIVTGSPTESTQP